MAVDIDSFLDKFEKRSKETNQEELEEKKVDVNLEFQKEIEDKLDQIKSEVQHEDFHILKTVYDEVKKFDEDLPNKFLGIEKKSSLTLKEIGEEYSENFYSHNQKQIQTITTYIQGHLRAIDTNLSQGHYVPLLKDLDNIKKTHAKFPLGFVKEKNELGEQIRQREVNIYTALSEYSRTKSAEIEDRMADLSGELSALVKTRNIAQIEHKILEIEQYLNQIPKILLSEVATGKIKVLNMLSSAQTYLQHLQEEEFETIKKGIFNLFDRFQKSLLNKDLETCLFIYDEILLEFEKMPSLFLSDKVELYKHINELYSSINSLVINSNVSLFLDAYKHSKTIDEVKDFIKTARLTGTIEKSNLDAIKDKINSLPANLKFEKEELKTSVADLLAYKLEKTKEDYSKNFSVDTPTSKPLPIEKEINLLYDTLKRTAKIDELETIHANLITLLNKVSLPEQQKKLLLVKIESTYDKRKEELK